jgi:hypothetical protein
MARLSRLFDHLSTQDTPTHLADEGARLGPTDAGTSGWIPPEQGAILPGDSQRLEAEWQAAAVAATCRPGWPPRRLPLLRRLGSRIARTSTSVRR